MDKNIDEKFYRQSLLKDFIPECGSFKNYSYGANSITGWRLSQEDRYICLPCPRFTRQWSFFGVYDGHGGAEVAEYLKRNLHIRIIENLRTYGDIKIAFDMGYKHSDNDIRELLQTEYKEIKDSIIKEFPVSDYQPSTSNSADAPVMSEDLLSEVKNEFFKRLMELQTESNESTLVLSTAESDNCEDKESKNKEINAVAFGTRSKKAQAQNPASVDLYGEIPKLVKAESPLPFPLSTTEQIDNCEAKESKNKETDAVACGTRSKKTQAQNPPSIDLYDEIPQLIRVDPLPSPVSTIEQKDNYEAKESKNNETKEEDYDSLSSKDEALLTALCFTKSLRILQKSRRSEFKKDPLIGLSCGSTATTVVFTDDILYVANIGDSRCIASINGQVKSLSVDHRPLIRKEEKRILKSGHKISRGRIDGGLNMSRAFGDFGLKNVIGLRQEQQAVIVEPSIHAIEINNDLDFIVVASDGIWNNMENEDVLKFVAENIQSEITLPQICAKIFDHILSKSEGRAGSDNMSIIIIKNELKYKNLEKTSNSENVKRLKK